MPRAVRSIGASLRGERRHSERYHAVILHVAALQVETLRKYTSQVAMLYGVPLHVGTVHVAMLSRVLRATPRAAAQCLEIDPLTGGALGSRLHAVPCAGIPHLREPHLLCKTRLGNSLSRQRGYLNP